MSAIHWRLTGFALAIVSVASMITWAASSSWEKVAELQAKLTSAQLASFDTADYFQAHLQELDYKLLRYTVQREPADREAFLKGWERLNAWIDIQKPTLTTPKELAILNGIDRAYDDYHEAATNLFTTIRGNEVTAGMDLAEFNRVEKQSKRLLSLAYNLVSAHQESLNLFLKDSRRSISFLRALAFGSLFLLLALGAWLASIVYREMINPLRMKLVESHAIIERQEKLASLGVLAAGVAHEIRNPLTAIKARLFMQQKRFRIGSPEHDDLAVIDGEIDRLETIVKNVLQFANPSEPRFSKLSTAVFFRQVRELLLPQLEAKGITLNVQASDDSEIRADAQQLKQVLINLIQNAAESIEGGGTVTLRERRETNRLGGEMQPVVVLEVMDTGKGISSEVQKRLFDPFFSTKETGTGLGLAIAARIVEKHGGALEFQTQINRGTTFGIILPEVEMT